MAATPDHCPNVSRCELFETLKTDSSLQFCLGVYCHADYRSCARFQHVQATKTKPPRELLPNGKRLTLVS